MTNLITEARELCEKATPGPWEWTCDDPEFLTLGKSGAEQEYHVLSAWKCKSCQTSGLSCLWPEKYDATFIARSRTLIPELCDALEKAQEQNKQLIHEVCKLACESVERDKALARLAAEVMAARDSMCWISVSERLPEIDVAVLVLHKYHRDEYNPVTIGRLYQPCDKRRKPYWTFVSIQASDGAVYNDGTDFICPGSEYVTHWRPLPEGPEGGNE